MNPSSTSPSFLSLRAVTLACAALAATLLAGCETTNMRMGSAESKTVATGAAAGESSANANTQLEHCSSPLGTVSLVENQDAGWYTILRNEYRLPPTSNLLRLLIQQSNCFVVVERSVTGMGAMNRERALMQSGEMRGGSSFGQGQMVASDYGLSPEIVFSNSDAGGIGGALGALIGGGGGQVLGQLGGSLKTREASAMLTLVDNRSGVQVSVSEGSASKSDFAGFGSLFGSSAGGRLGGYQNTSQGKVLTAAFMDAYNQMVMALRNYKAQKVQGQGLGGGGRLGVDGGAAPSQTKAGASMSVREAQARLNALGYDVGAPDGGMGPKTTNGLRAFQKDKGLPVTGRLDSATTDALSR
ncbi:peptidoglycan-binding protein [Paracidovorax avenae]|uniref:peptidoglycan-binding protein n=1 Tax=Paracidovorax avenae TaxID=80867 RepID=UPI000D168013|nr:peptidoglycan-binding protein [Paracidovorax avenae]AVS61035.1 peptidoglycan-binding protein [Paracidovorax avenae]AVS92092.1 peptidoglycan-binding protein [Paracidovorax avenae]AVT19341.1 peptidoglycan-binding protein [Paracidovorax avenae]